MPDGEAITVPLDRELGLILPLLPLTHSVERLRTCWLITRPSGCLAVGGAAGEVTTDRVRYVVERTR